MSDDGYDSGDLDAIRELEASPGYSLVRGRLLEELERKRSELERPADGEKTAMLRGAIAQLRTVLSVPEILQSEIRGSLKE